MWPGKDSTAHPHCALGFCAHALVYCGAARSNAPTVLSQVPTIEQHWTLYGSRDGSPRIQRPPMFGEAGARPNAWVVFSSQIFHGQRKTLPSRIPLRHLKRGQPPTLDVRQLRERPRIVVDAVGPVGWSAGGEGRPHEPVPWHELGSVNSADFSLATTH